MYKLRILDAHAKLEPWADSTKRIVFTTIIHIGGLFISQLPLRGKLGWCHASGGGMNPGVVAVCQDVRECRLGIRAESELMAQMYSPLSVLWNEALSSSEFSASDLCHLDELGRMKTPELSQI